MTTVKGKKDRKRGVEIKVRWKEAVKRERQERGTQIQECNRKKRYKRLTHANTYTRWRKVCDHIEYDSFDRIGCVDRLFFPFLCEKFADNELTDVWAFGVFERDGTVTQIFLRRVSRKKRARCWKKKGRTLIVICGSFFSRMRAYFLSPPIYLSLFRSYSLALPFSLARYHTTRKMQRITIFFLSPFVHKMSNLILEARFLYLHAPCKITTFSLTVAPIHILF